MKLTYSFSSWNGMTTNKPYHKKPTIKEVSDTKQSKVNPNIRIHDRKDGIRILIDGDFVELRASVANSLTNNKYSDVYNLS